MTKPDAILAWGGGLDACASQKTIDYMKSIGRAFTLKDACNVMNMGHGIRSVIGFKNEEIKKCVEA